MTKVAFDIELLTHSNDNGSLCYRITQMTKVAFDIELLTHCADKGSL